MKKKVQFIFLLLLILSAFLVAAATPAVTDVKQEEIDAKAYACLESKVNDKCAALSSEEKIFSLLAIGKCRQELIAEESSLGCWPKDDCNIKITSQAILALKKAGDDTTKAENWLLSHSISASSMEWFLQVEAGVKSSCTVSYSDKSYTFSLNEDKTLSKNAGNCLAVYQDYWFKVAPSCYGSEFKISCNDGFSTSLLYRKKSSQTTYDFYVSDKTSTASGEGTTTEKVESSCFSEGRACSYEGTLWAAAILKYLGKDVSAYLPYLITMSEENSKYIPEAFLYILTDNFKVDLLAKQKEGGYWSESGDRFYDTAVALFPFQNDLTLTEKTNSKNWLKEVQGNNGCWQDSIRDTAFLLYSLWAKKPAISTGGTTGAGVTTANDCELSNYFCSSTASCSTAGGIKLEGYSGCFGTNICCSKQRALDSCYKQGGELCSSGEKCMGGTEVDASDSTAGKTCCAKGTCEIPTITEESECESNQGVCKSSCSSDESATSDSCPSSQTCCFAKSAGNPSALVIIILGILIVLTLIGIVLRKRLREFFLRFKFKGKSSPSQGSPRFPPSSSSRIYPGAVQRRILPSQNQQAQRRPAQGKSEVDDVLKKLKEIGK